MNMLKLYEKGEYEDETVIPSQFFFFSQLDLGKESIIKGRTQNNSKQLVWEMKGIGKTSCHFIHGK